MAKTKLTATVLNYFEDLQDNDRAYNMGDIFPHAEVGYTVTDKRMHELASEDNKRNQKLININEATEQVDPYVDLTVAELKELAKERGIDVPAKSKREDLIALLEK